MILDKELVFSDAQDETTIAAHASDNIIDLTKDCGKKYFMEDTIHLGWNGWLTMDQAVRPFMAKKYVAPSYYLDDYYYTRGWRERKQVPATSLTNKQVLARLRSK